MNNNDYITARLADGTVLRFPKETPPEVVERVAKEQTIARNLDKIEVPQDLPWYEDAYEWTKKNMELPLGLGGAAGGAFVGSFFGPVGTLAGTVIGGAVGSGSGSVASDVLQDVPIDYADALKEAAISAGIDIVTIGAGSKIKAFLEARKALGVSPQEAAQQLINSAKEGKPLGSQESLMATQRLLQEGGATLLPSQTGRASALQEFSESVAEIGVLSGATLAENTRKVNAVIEDNLNKIIERNATGALDSASLGEELNSVISAGRRAMVSSYGSSLDEIMPLIKRGSAPTQPIRNRIKAFRSQYVTKEIVKGKPIEAVSNLSTQTASFIGELNKILELPTLTGESLVALDKKVTQKITDIAESLGKGESGVGTADLDQLRKLSTTLKDGIQDSIKRIDPDAAADYQKLKAAYSENMGGLLPTINSTMLSGIASGKRGTEVLGKLLVTVRDPEKIEAFMRSIDTAYKGMGKDAAELTFKTADEAKQAIKASFLEKSFNLSATEAKDFSRYTTLAKQWGSKDGKRGLAAIFGKDTPRVMQLVNMMAETSTKTDSNFLGLSIRGKEVGAAGQVVGAGFTGLGGAAAILGLPVVLAKAATNPKTVNQLLAFEKKKFNSESAKQAAAAAILANITADMSMAEKEEFRLKTQLEEKQRGL